MTSVLSDAEVIGLFKPKAHAFGFLGATNFADDSLAAALTLRNWLREAHLRLLEWHDAALQNLAIEATNEVLVSLVLIFTCNFDCHTRHIIANFSLLYNPNFVV